MMRRPVSNPARRPLPTLVAVSSRVSRNKPRTTAGHPLRRADDQKRDMKVLSSAKDASTPRLMTDWPADKAWDKRVQRHLRSPVWYSKPYLLAALWGRLPSAPRE